MGTFYVPECNTSPKRTSIQRRDWHWFAFVVVGRWGSPPPRPHVEQGITSVRSSQRSFAVKWEGWLFYVRVMPWAHWLITHSSSASSPSSLHKRNIFTRSSGTCRNMSYGGRRLSFCAEQDVTWVFTRWRNEAWHWCVHLINLGVVRSRNLVVIHTEWLRTRKVDYKDEKKSVFTSLNHEDWSCLIRTEEKLETVLTWTNWA